MPSALDVAKKLLASFVSQDIDAALSVMAENIVIHAPYSPPDIPLPKSIHGKQAVAEMLRVMFGASEKFELFDIDLHTTDNPELIFGTGHSRAMMKNGQAYGNHYVYVFYIRDGKIFDYYEYFDSHVASQGFSFAKV